MPYLGPPSEYAVVKMIPDNRLPPRNLHKVWVEKTQATLKWQPPYDTPSAPLVRPSPPRHNITTGTAVILTGSVLCKLQNT